MRQPRIWIVVALVSGTSVGCASATRRVPGSSPFRANSGITAPTQRVISPHRDAAMAGASSDVATSDHDGIFARPNSLNRFFPGLQTHSDASSSTTPPPVGQSSGESHPTEGRASWIGRHFPHFWQPAGGSATPPPTTLSYSTTPRRRDGNLPRTGVSTGEGVSVLPVALTVPSDQPRDRQVAKTSTTAKSGDEKPAPSPEPAPAADSLEMAPPDPRYLLSSPPAVSEPSSDAASPPASEGPAGRANEVPEPAQVAPVVDPGPARPEERLPTTQPEPAPPETPAAEVISPPPPTRIPEPEAIEPTQTPVVIPEPAPVAPEVTEPKVENPVQAAEPRKAEPETPPATDRTPEPKPKAVEPESTREPVRIAREPDPRERPRATRTPQVVDPNSTPKSAATRRPTPTAEPTPRPRSTPTKTIPATTATDPSHRAGTVTETAQKEGRARAREQDRLVRAARVQADAARTLGLPDPTLPASYYAQAAPPVRGDAEVATTATTSEDVAPTSHHGQASGSATPGTLTGPCPHCGHDPGWRPSLQRFGRRLLGVGEFAPKTSPR